MGRHMYVMTPVIIFVFYAVLSFYAGTCAGGAHFWRVCASELKDKRRMCVSQPRTSPQQIPTWFHLRCLYWTSTVHVSPQMPVFNLCLTRKWLRAAFLKYSHLVYFGFYSHLIFFFAQFFSFFFYLILRTQVYQMTRRWTCLNHFIIACLRFGLLTPSKKKSTLISMFL